MDKRSKNMAKRILAALLSVMLVSGTAVMTPAYKNISSGIVVNAVEPSQGFEFSAANVTFTMNGEDLTVSESGEIHIAANAANVQPNVTIKDGDYTLTDADVTVEFGEGNWTTPGSEITVTVVGIGAYEDTTPVQFTFVVDLKTGNLYDGKVSIADLKAGDILKKGTTLSNGYVTGSTDVDNFVNTPKIVLLGGRYMGEDETGIAEEDYSAPKNFLSWGDSISIDEETSNLILPMYVSGTDEDTHVHKVTGVFSPIGENGEDGDAWQVFSNENGVLVLQGILTPTPVAEAFVVDSVASVKYTGEAQRPVVVKDSEGTELIEGDDYIITYSDNVNAGIATAVVEGINGYYGKTTVNFEIMAAYDLSAVLGDSQYEIIVVDGRGNSATVIANDENGGYDEEGKVWLRGMDEDGRYHGIIYSNVELTFDTDEEMYPLLGKSVKYQGKSYYAYYIQTAIGSNEVRCNVVKGEHDHDWDSDGKTNTSILKMWCKDELNPPVITVAQLTVDTSKPYYYGDKVNISALQVEDIDNPVNNYGVTNDDVRFTNMKYYPKGQSNSPSETAPTNFGEYTIEARVDVEQLPTVVALFHDFEIQKKPIADIDLAFFLDGEKQTLSADGKYVITYDTNEHTPSVALTHKKFYNNATQTESDVALVEGTDYTATFTPVKGKNANGGDEVEYYLVEVEAVYEINEETGEKVYTGNYTGKTSFKWYIDKAEMLMQLNVPAEYVYDNTSNYENSFKVTKKAEAGQTPVDLPDDNGDAAGNGFNVGEYTYEEFVDGEWVAFTDGRKPKEVGHYRATTTVTAQNYVDQTVSAEFDIVRAEVTVTPQTAEITYGDATPVVAYTLGGVVEGGETVAATGLVVIDGTENTRTGVLDVKRNAQNEVIAYDYKFDTDSDNAPVVADGDNFNYGRNYKLVLVTSGEGGVKYNFTVNPKAITENMFAFAATEFTYNRTEQSVNVTGTDVIGGVDFMNGTADYTLGGDVSATDANRIVAGKENGYVVSAAGKGNYTGELTLTQTWKINPKSIAKPEDETTPDDINAWSTNSPATYNKAAQKPEVKVTDGAAELVEEAEGVENPEFKVLEHDDFINAGTYTFQVEGVGNYTDTRDVTFVIGKVKAEDIELKIIGESTPIYDGETIVDEYHAVATNVDEEEYNFKYAWFDAEGNEITADEEGETIQVVNAGTYTLVVTATDSPNYENKTAEKTITIQKRHTDIYPDENQSIEYGDDTENIVIKYDFEKAEGNRGVVAADIDEDGNSRVDFSQALAVDFDEELTQPYPVGTYYIYVVDNEELFDNYIVDDLDYEPEFEITPKQIKREMFTLTLDNGATDPAPTLTVAGADYNENNVPSVVFSGKKVTAAITSDELTTPADYRVSGTTAVYVSSVDFGNNYKTEIYGRGNYAGYVDFEWAVTKDEKVAVITVPAETVYNRANPQPVEATVAMAGDLLMPSDAVVTLTYWKDNKDGTYTQLDSAPVNAGSYKVTAEITSRNYEIGAAPAYFHISRELVDEDVSINPTVVTAFDFGVASVGVDGVDVVLDNITKLEKGVDYELAGTTETNVPGEYTVQVIGTGEDYFGTAVATWTLTEEGEDKDAAIADIKANVKVDFARDGEEVDVVGQFLNGRKNVILGLDVTGADGETYKVLKKGIVYFNGEGEPAELTEKNSKAASKKGTSYLIPDIGNGIYARAYAVVAKVVSTDEYGDNGYQTTVYSDVYQANYYDVVRYTAAAVNGSVQKINIGDEELMCEEGTNSVTYTGKQFREAKEANKNVYVTFIADDTNEAGQEFSYWKMTSNDQMVATSTTYICRFTDDIELEAVYGVEGVEHVPAMGVTGISVDEETGRVYYDLTRNVPEGYTVIENGALYGTSKALFNNGLADENLKFVSDDGTTERKSKVYVGGTSGNNDNNGFYTFYVKQSGNPNTIFFVRGYTIVEDGEGVRSTYYSDVAKTTYNELVGLA